MLPDAPTSLNELRSTEPAMPSWPVLASMCGAGVYITGSQDDLMKWILNLSYVIWPHPSLNTTIDSNIVITSLTSLPQVQID